MPRHHVTFERVITAKEYHSSMDATIIIWIGVGIVVGWAIGTLLASTRSKTEVETLRGQLTDASVQNASEVATARVRTANLEELQTRLIKAEGLAETRLHALDARNSEYTTLREQLGRIESQATERDRAHEEKLVAFTKVQAEATLQFEKLANDLLEAKAKSLTATNTKELIAIIDPFKAGLSDLGKKIEEVYVTEGKDRASLSEHVKILTELNKQVSDQTQGLTDALRGSSKAQGDWGELVLARTLVSSGLREGHEFVTQESLTDADGNRLRPDVVLTLANGRKVVIDSKVSLKAWVQYTEATDQDGRDDAAKALVASVRAHLKGLSPKGYENLYGADSLDFVVMFVPLEGAFFQALATDPTLQDDAWKQQVLFAGPTTILFALRTIAHIWRQERQTRNALAIADQAGGLYDKFVGFLTDMEAVEKALERATQAQIGARRALITEKGNIVRRVEALRALGVRTKKEIGDTWLETSDPGPIGLLSPPDDGSPDLEVDPE